MTAAAVLSIGTELTRGELTNSNASWLGEELTALGFHVLEHATVDDHEGRIVGALSRLSKSVRVVVCTGGLGPTTDDITAQTVAKALGVPVVRDEATLDGIRKRWATLGREMPASNVRQADVPQGARILRNDAGTAPGFAVEWNGASLFFMPGVPREMKPMFQGQVAPAISALVEHDSHQIHLRTFGLPESEVQDKLQGVEDMFPGVILGYRAHIPEIEVKVFARAASAEDAQTVARRAEAEVRNRLGAVIYGGREDSFAGSVGALLRNKGQTLAVAESCTGGMIGAMLTAVPGSSDYLLLDAVCYANTSKEKVLGVRTDTLRAHGAVSGEVAVEMVEGALRVSGADVAVSVTGIAGPGGGTDDKPVGTVWFGIGRRGEPVITKKRHFPGDRERVRILASYVALELVARAVRGSAS